MLVIGKLTSHHKGGIRYEVGKQSHRQCRFDRRHRPVHPCQFPVALGWSLEKLAVQIDKGVQRGKMGEVNS